MKKAQIWVETVVYTLIGLSLIAVVLTLVMPRINEFRDKSVIEQTISSLNSMDSKIQDVISGGVGNARTIEFNMRRGKIFFDKENEDITFVLEDSEVIFSEPGVETEIGRIIVLTEEGTAENKVSLKLDYNFDLNFSESDNEIVFLPSTIPYKFRFENAGFGNDGKQIVFFREA